MNDDKIYKLNIGIIKDDLHHFDIKNIQSIYTGNEYHTFTLECKNCGYDGSKNLSATVHNKLNDAIVYNKLMKYMSIDRCASGHTM